jgi:hypothetical protein
MRPTLQIAFITGATIFGADEPTTVVRELRTGPIRYAVLAGRLNEDQVTAAALNLLGAREVKLGRLVVYASRTAAMVIERENDLDECGWKQLATAASANGVQIAPDHCPEVMEAIKIDSAIVLRTVDQNCGVKSRLLRGKHDPLWVSVGDTRVEILALSFKPHIKDQFGGERVFVHVFARSESGLSVETARVILTRFRRLSSAREISVAMRNDDDFVMDCSFPAPYLFGGSAAITPLDAEHPRTGALVRCSVFAPSPVNCRSWGLKERQ